METEHEFTLILDGVSDLDDKAVDALYEAGCDDSTIMTRAGRVMIGFIRSAPTREDAVLSAIDDIERAKVCTRVKELDPKQRAPMTCRTISLLPSILSLRRDTH